MARQGLMGGLLRSMGLVRVSDVEENKGFRAARTGRLSTFEGERQHINTAIKSGGALLRSRSRFFCRENNLGISGKETFVAYVVGTGIFMSLAEGNATLKRAWKKALNEFSAICDYDGRTNLDGLIAEVAGEVFEAGEGFLLFHDTTEGLRLQSLPSEQLPYNLVTARDQIAGSTIRLGIEFFGAKRVAYHFLKHHPGDTTAPPAERLQTTRIPAERVCHVFRRLQPGQIRGVPWTAGALVPGSKLDDYENALLERANAGTRPIAAITKKDMETDRSSGLGGGAVDNGDGSATLDLEPGSLFELNPGEGLDQIEPPDPGANYGEFAYRQSSRATAAMGMPYAEVTGDLRQATYSSARIGRMPFKRKVERFQHLDLAPQLLRPVWRAFVTDALLRGYVALPRGAARTLAAYATARNNFPAWEYVDPEKDAKTDVLLVDNLLKDRDAVIEERGWDPEETDDRIAASQKREKRLKLKRGGKAAVEAAPADEAKPQPKEEDEEA